MARSFGAQGFDKIDFAGRGAPVLFNQLEFWIAFYFKRGTAPTSGAVPYIFSQFAAFNILVDVFMQGNGGANDGKFTLRHRTTTASAAFNSTSAWDDGLLHRGVVIRQNSSPFLKFFVDGVADGDSGADSDPTTDATAPINQYWGNSDSGTAGWGGELARCASGVGRASIAELDEFLKTGRMPRRPPSLWYEMRGDAVEPDWSGNGRYGLLTGTTIAPHGAIRQVRDPRLAERVVGFVAPAVAIPTINLAMAPYIPA